MNALELHAIHKSFGGVPAIKDVSLSIAPGSRTAIVGPSGSGKTTLLRMIAGFEFPDSGRIALHGQWLVNEQGEVPAHQRNIGYVPQDGALFPHLNVADNIGFGLPGNSAGKRQQVAELIERVALDPAMASRWPHELSGGQQQRVALARALAQQPRLMLLDEPFSALDTGLRAAMRKSVTKVLAEAGIATILVTHDQAEALSFADQLLVMRQGRLVQAGAPQALYLNPVDEETAVFLGDALLFTALADQGLAHCDLGQVSISDALCQGQVRIMLRPEQVLLIPAHAATSNIQGRVTDIDFGGNNCLVTVELDPPLSSRPVKPHSIVVRSPGHDIPAVGSRVGFSIQGQAHVFA
ncbi:ABC transporter ATP-binding protein [Pseudomonas sp. Pseusp122]|uniref:ABC transporter ATP-binding protein n=1 Tax=unclassified Pseudomonas TaxID=196821 RepID=UPI0039A4DCE5